jgi:hypothetical protein
MKIFFGNIAKACQNIEGNRKSIEKTFENIEKHSNFIKNFEKHSISSMKHWKNIQNFSESIEN